MIPHPLSGGDPNNRLFSWQGRLFRGITAETAPAVRLLFSNGLVDGLVADYQIPATQIATKKIEGFELVLEHEWLPHVTYAHEWTFEMLRDAALFVLALRERLIARGYDLLDAHCDNVTFHRGKPIWLDFGSIVPNSRPQVWAAERRFRQSFLFPLLIWSRLGEFIGRRLLVTGDYMPREAALLATRWWARRLSPKRLKQVCAVLDNYAAIPGAPLPVLEAKLRRISPWRVFARTAPVVARNFLQRASDGRLPFHSHSCRSLSQKIRSIRKRGYSTRWEHYHTGVLQEVAAFERYPRFQRLIELLKERHPKSITEIGTNQGALAQLLLKDVQPEQMICLDIDDGALDRFYCRNRDQKEDRVTHGVLDVMRPFTIVPKASPEGRFKSEALVALAVTHHMVLGQCNSIDHLFSRLASFTTKWIFVEYMPHGFHTEPVETPPPDTYSARRFDDGFRRRFEVVSIEQLEPTRVLYVGKLRTCEGPLHD